MNKDRGYTLSEGVLHHYIVNRFEGIDTQQLREIILERLELIKKLLNECPDFILEENKTSVCSHLHFTEYHLDVNSYGNVMLLDEGEENVRKRRRAYVELLNGARASALRMRKQSKEC